MKLLSALAMLAALGGALPADALPAGTSPPASVASMRWHQRILLLVTPQPDDPQAVAQRRILAEWHAQAADRDVALVEIAGARVSGASDSAAALFRRYRLSPGAFHALLIGKDGHVALRSAKPIDAGILQGTIDAMPMRRSGER
ncbi:DUF4174 domain-containing protein [Sphingomonas abietis]|uniref:DUF4174 domain-containing protein n=1 Tax=Sphingomonas abietis TaxID=3012344 RepID=A0ABY7NRL9_9SPHN|nr:DUF4174 domain-containing protein [Sphingomonas abietis]WBO23837.1 DUF4174 domain-containing protein [Sphingomonas abietis]